MILRTVSSFLLVFVLLCIPSVVAQGELVPEIDPECPRPIFWNTVTGDHEWSNPSNWETAEDTVSLETPQPFNQVFLQNGSTLLDDLSLSISSMRIESQHRLVISGSSKLVVKNVELHCWGTNWCHGHGACVDIDVCKCDPGYTGTECEEVVCAEGVAQNPCGICENAPESLLNQTCSCIDFLGREPEEVDRLLLVDTNKGLIQGLDDAVQLLAAIKDAVSAYDPNSRLIEADIVDWILYLQSFIADSVDPFAATNLELLKQLETLSRQHKPFKRIKA